MNRVVWCSFTCRGGLGGSLLLGFWGESVPSHTCVPLPLSAGAGRITSSGEEALPLWNMFMKRQESVEEAKWLSRLLASAINSLQEKAQNQFHNP